uniref:non-specific serine/threonine protein kinase n=1 Tax=Mola mola TaxID=94237 RepID=A0A3Q4AQK8_MOLML
MCVYVCTAEFEARYQELTRLGVGGFGSVFAGFRKNDYLPVAIKHIPKKNVVLSLLCSEVAVMLAISAGTNGSVGMSLPVTLLDWYDVHQELILVLERPVPCEDLYKYCKERGGSIEEKEIILKQVVDATKYLEDKCIFHRDIKLENILIETSLDVPRARLIDFGLSCFFKKKSVYTVFYGTPKHAPPEWGHFGTYKAGPTTVWQLGVLLFEALNNEASFETQRFLKKKLTTNIKGLSENCQDFLRKCLAIVPEERSTLEELQNLP